MTQTDHPGYSWNEESFEIEDPELGLSLSELLKPHRVHPKLNIPEGAELYQSEGELVEKVALENKKRQGQCVIYYPEGTVKSECYYNNDLLHGPSLFYSKEGALLAVGFFVNGIRTGKNWQYYTSGKLYSLQQFVEGGPEGIQKYYYESGELKSSIPYKKGQLEGTVNQYYENGQLFRSVEFSEGKREGRDQQFFKNGRHMIDIKYRKDEPTDYLKMWHDNSMIAEDYEYLGSPNHFNVRKYDRDGALWLDGTHIDEANFKEEYISKEGNVYLTKHYTRSGSELVLNYEEKVGV